MSMRELLTKVIYPITAVTFLALLFYPLCLDNGNCDYLKLWILVGIPFGIQKMFVWLIPKGFDIGGTIGVVVFNILIGGVIGGVILIWRIIVALCCVGKIIFLGVRRLYRKRVSL